MKGCPKEKKPLPHKERKKCDSNGGYRLGGSKPRTVAALSKGVTTKDKVRDPKKEHVSR